MNTLFTLSEANRGLFKVICQKVYCIIFYGATNCDIFAIDVYIFFSFLGILPFKELLGRQLGLEAGESDAEIIFLDRKPKYFAGQYTF